MSTTEAGADVGGRATPSAREHTPQQRVWLNGLRELLEFCEQHPDLTPRGESVSDGLLGIVFCGSPEVWERKARQLDGVPDDDEYYQRDVRRFGPHKLMVYAEVRR